MLGVAVDVLALVGIPGGSGGKVDQKESENVAGLDASQNNAVAKARRMIVQPDDPSRVPVHQKPNTVAVSRVRAGKVGGDVTVRSSHEVVYFWIDGAAVGVGYDRAGLRTGHELGCTQTRE